MIINTTGIASGSISKSFTLQSDVNYPSVLTITGVDLPGGVVHGFSLFLVNNESLSQVLQDEEIMYAFADKTLAENGQFSYAILTINSSDARFNTKTTPAQVPFGFTYDSTNHTFSLEQNHMNSKWCAGTYQLVIW